MGLLIFIVSSFKSVGHASNGGGSSLSPSLVKRYGKYVLPYLKTARISHSTRIHDHLFCYTMANVFSVLDKVLSNFLMLQKVASFSCLSTIVCTLFSKIATTGRMSVCLGSLGFLSIDWFRTMGYPIVTLSIELFGRTNSSAYENREKCN